MPTYYIKIVTPEPVPFEVLEQIKNNIKSILASYYTSITYVEIVKEKPKEEKYIKLL